MCSHRHLVQYEMYEGADEKGSPMKWRRNLIRTQFAKRVSLLMLIMSILSVGKSIIASEQNRTAQGELIIKVIITIFDDGDSQTLPKESPASASIRQQVERIFINSDDALYELVTNRTIQNIKSDESAVELIYTRPVVVEIKNPVLSKHEIKIDRLLIPLSGIYPSGTVFYGLGGYGSGPVLYRAGVDKLRTILASYGL